MPNQINHQQAIQQLHEIFESIPFNQFLGMELTYLTHSSVNIRLKKQNPLIGNFLQDILHGGVISSVLDMAGGILTMVHVIHQHPQQSLAELHKLLGKISTVDLYINYLNPGQGDHFTAHAKLDKIGKKLAFSQMELINQDGICIALGRGTYLI